MIKIKSVPGPVYAAATPPTVRFGEFEKVLNASIDARGAAMRRSDLVTRAEVTLIAGVTVTFRVYQINTTTVTPTAWAEIADATDLSGVTFTVVAEAE